MRRCTTTEPIDVVHWMSKVSLDIIGPKKVISTVSYAAGLTRPTGDFRYDFGSLDGRDTELEKAMKHMLYVADLRFSRS